LTVTDKQTIRKRVNINHKNTQINRIQIKENRQLNIQQKQNYPDSVASYDTQPGNEVGLFYNGPEHHTGRNGLGQPQFLGDKGQGIFSGWGTANVFVVAATYVTMYTVN